jgi:hypothetical protein
MLIAATILGLAACSAVPEASDEAPSFAPPVGEADGAGFTLTITAGEARVAAGQEIHVGATLAHGEPGDVTLTGSGSGVVFFSVTRVEDGLTSGPPVHTDDCAVHEIPPGDGVTVPFAKSGGFSPDDPNADFLEIYFADPALSLPAGTWRIEATTSATIGEGCIGEPLDLAASVEVVVSD